MSDFSELDLLMDKLEDYGISTTKQTQNQETSKRVPYIEFRSPDGWQVLVGRTSRDNDELTFHIAHKEDFWFHAENVPGSHVIAVPDNKRIDKPPKATLEYAASLAAGHSQAKHSSVVPVVYTKRKYVTKPKDAGPGLVRYQYEDSVIVKPRRS
jgi:predicted ribosome quality control (RQC) complex YloA/Tae2 family protein